MLKPPSTIPAAPALDDGRAPRPPSVVPPRGRPSILLVDDDLGSANIIARLLGVRYDVTLAEDGLEGLLRAELMPSLDLIIADVVMPRLDGFTMVQRIKQIPSKHAIPVIFLTGLKAPMDIIHGIQAGAHHYLMKPISLEELEHRVHRLLDPRRSTAPPPPRDD